ncbi:hypothetical protein CFIMG_006616RA [Ceratocystis fimbriata CBS 114723]|uniref:Uncharacterized protein n=1 Tax=Ceratocystis fimbriata CBS 114723 TaxID=1035309 RepID=A0A2C5WUI0_9PEZI|nr:hypothetical protein CFIMG_006616RA [Ceratocystis fimbriata CBS 114723]
MTSLRINAGQVGGGVNEKGKATKEGFVMRQRVYMHIAQPHHSIMASQEEARAVTDAQTVAKIETGRSRKVGIGPAPKARQYQGFRALGSLPFEFPRSASK